MGYQNVETPRSSLTSTFARRAGVVSALAAGVTADGTTDDTAALQAVIDSTAALGGGTVLLPRGTIVVSDEITIPEHVWVVGEAPGGWENYGVVNAGTTIKLKASSGLTSSQAVIRFQYEGSYTSERRHQGGMAGVTIDGNRPTNTANSGIILAGVRFVHLYRVHVVRCGLHGFYSLTDGTSTSEISLVATFAGFNGGSGYYLFGGDSTITEAMAGVNEYDGFYLGLGATVCTGLSAWNNKRDGLGIAVTAATEFMSIVGGEFYDNDRAGINIEAPGANAMVGNSIVGASCHGNGLAAYEGVEATDRWGATGTNVDKAGIRVAGVYSPNQLRISGVTTGNRPSQPTATAQQYGVALLTSTCNPTMADVSGTNNVQALIYTPDSFGTPATIPEASVGRMVPFKDNLYSLGRSAWRFYNMISMRFEVYKNANEANPVVRIGSTTGAADINFGPGGASAVDWTLSRGAASRADLGAGDSLKADGTWDGGTFILGTYRLWVDGSGLLRIKNGTPASDTDGTIVGTQA